MIDRHQKKAIRAYHKQRRDEVAEELRIEREQRLADRIEQHAMDRATMAALTEIADEINRAEGRHP